MSDADLEQSILALEAELNRLTPDMMDYLIGHQFGLMELGIWLSRLKFMFEATDLDAGMVPALQRFLAQENTEYTQAMINIAIAYGYARAKAELRD